MSGNSPPTTGMHGDDDGYAIVMGGAALHGNTAPMIQPLASSSAHSREGVVVSDMYIPRMMTGHRTVLWWQMGRRCVYG